MCILDPDVGDYWMGCNDGLLLRVITGIVITLHSVILVT